MLRYAGIALFSGGICLLGITKSAYFKEQILIRKEILRLLCSIERKVAYGKSKDDIIKEFNSGILERCGFLSFLKAGNFKDIKELPIDGEDAGMLSDFYSNLGKRRSANDEAAYVKAFIREFEECGTRKTNKLITKAKLYKKLGLILALTAAILFI